MKQIILGIILSFFLVFVTHSAGICTFEGYRYLHTETQEEYLLNVKVNTSITTFPISTFDNKYVENIYYCIGEERENLNNVQFSSLDYVAIFLNTIFYIFVILILPCFILYKIHKQDRLGSKNIIISIVRVLFMLFVGICLFSGLIFLGHIFISLQYLL